MNAIKKFLHIFSKENGRELQDMEFMSTVDAARSYKGSPIAYVLSLGMVLIFAVFFIWSTLSTRDEITQGQGQIIPSQGVQPVQSEDGGIIKEILVSENELVEKGTLLATISNIRAVGEFQELTQKKVEYEFALQRLRAEQDGKELDFTDEQRAQFPDVVYDQEMLFKTRRAQFEGEGKQLSSALEQRKLELAESYQRREQYEKKLLLLKKQEASILPLVQSKSYSQVEYLNLKQRIVTMESDLKSLAVNIARTISAVDEAQNALNNRESERLASIAKDINDFHQELNSITERLKAGTDIVQRSELRSVVRGVVKRILLKEEAVVRPAELLMEIVPTDDTLEVEAKFRPAHRGFLEVGQNATVKVSAYDSAVYGTLAATVASISPDTIEDNKGEAWYVVRLRTSSTRLPHLDKNLDIKVGMTVTVDVLSGEKSVFSYLVKPLFKSRQQGKAIGTKATD